MKHFRSCLLAGVALLALAQFVSAQVQTGTPPFGSFTGGPDVINLGNLNSHLAVPIFSKPGRGLPFTYALSFDNSTWTPVGAIGTQSWQPDTYWGWHALTAVMTGFVAYSRQGGHCNLGTRTDPYLVYFNLYTFKFYSDQFGTIHAINAPTIVDDTTCTGSSYPTFANTTATDGSGYSFHVEAGSATVYPRSGGSIVPPLNTNSGNGTVTDSNGNQISAGSSTFTDTLGMTALTVSGSAPNPTVFTYTDSNGTQRTVTMNYTTYTVQTNFACSGVSEYGPTSVSLVSSISFPNGTSYSFTYEATPGVSGPVTGRVKQITLPTGGTITYAYAGGNNGIECADGSTAGLTRTTIDGTTTYTRSGSGTAWTTAVTDAQSNQTVINFQTASGNFYETHRAVNQGASTWLSKTDTCYNGATPDCTATTISQPFTEIKQYVTSNNNQQSLRDTLLSNGLVTQVSEYDYGASAPGPLLRQTSTGYQTLGNGTLVPAYIKILDGSSTQIAYQGFSYDGGTLTTTSGVPQHVAVSATRGNLTSLSRWLNTTNSYLSSTFTYDDTGNVLTSTHPNGDKTTFSYTDSWANTSCTATNTLAYLTQITNALSQNTKMTYYPCTGLVQASADQNDINASRSGTTYTYDLENRLVTTSYRDGGAFSSSYNDIWPNLFVQHSALQTAGNSVQLDQTWSDQMGRYTQKVIIDPLGNDYTSTSYDSLGRGSTVTDLHRTANNPSYGNTQIQYDALSRVTKVTKSDGSFSTVDYSQFPVVTVTDEAGKVRKNQFDGLGRRIKVWEDPNGLNYETDYQYDVLGNLLRVDQKGSAPSDSTQWRTRTFTYDSLSRPLCVSQPEVGGPVTCPTPDNGTYTTGTIRYTYDNNGNVLTRQAPAPNQTGSATVTTTYTYDPLNRVTQKSYSDSTPAAFFTYDVASQWGVTLTNSVGRLTEQWTGTSCCATGGATIYGYDPMGRVVLNNQYTPGMGYQSVGYTYDLLGDMTSYTTGVGVTFTQSFDALGRFKQLTSSLSDSQHPATLATVDSTVGYYATGALRKITYGNSLTESQAYNIRLQPCHTNVNSSGGTLLNCADAAPGGTLQDINYGFNAGTADNGNLVSFSPGVAVILSASMLSQSGMTGYIQGQIVDGNTSTNGWHTDSATAGAWLQVDLGAGNQNAVTQAKIYAAYAGYAGNYTVQYSDNGSTWSAASAGFVPSNSGWNSQSWNNAGAHRYWRLYLTNTPGVGPWLNELQLLTQSTRSYGYDSLNRLTSMSAPGDSCNGLSWNLDAWGNRTDQNNTGGTCFIFHQPVNSQNRLSASPYQYDAAGNLTNDGLHTYTYDAENRLTQVDSNPTTASYAYDALGRRVHKAYGSTWVDEVYDLSGNVVTELNNRCGSACWARSFIYLAGQRIAEYGDSTTYFAHRDHLGSTRLMTAAAPSTRIQSTGGTSLTKYYYTVGMSVNGTVYTVSAWIKNQGTAPVQINGNLGYGVTVAPGTTQFVNFNTTGNGVSAIQFLFNTSNVGDPIDVLAYWPSITSGGGNLIPVANQNFSGWNSYQGSSVTVTQGQTPIIVDSMDYAPYGELIAGGTRTSHKFTGDERDSESNLDHTWFRQYSSVPGRWLSPDPYSGSMDITNPQSLNRYVYVLNNPLSMVDQNGAWPTWLHHDILSWALPGLSSQDLNILMRASDYVDRWDNQGPEGSNEHGMCAPQQDLNDCSAGITQVINDNLFEANFFASLEGGRPMALWYLGLADHTGTDLTSPWHTDDNGTPLCWGCNIVNDSEHVIDENILPLEDLWLFRWQIQRAIEVVRGWYALVFGPQAAASAFQPDPLAGYRQVLGRFGILGNPIMEGMISACIGGNPAACPNEADWTFLQLIGQGGGGGGGVGGGGGGNCIYYGGKFQCGPAY